MFSDSFNKCFKICFRKKTLWHETDAMLFFIVPQKVRMHPNRKPSGKMSKCLTNKIVSSWGQSLESDLRFMYTCTRYPNMHASTSAAKKKRSVLLVKHILIESPFFILSFAQLQWNVYPICYLPTPLRAKPISDLNATGLDLCTDFDNDLYDMSGISENILLIHGNINSPS